MILKVLLLLSLAHADTYKDFQDLKKNTQSGKDYRITLVDRNHAVTVTAIHGGFIERGTSELAKALAGEKYNLYLFEGIREANNWDLHVTSTKFNDPQLLSLVERSEVIISFHGFRGKKHRWVAMGGNNEKLKLKIYKSLKATGIIDQDEPNPIHRLYGKSPKNFVNKARQRGVQIEISTGLRDHLAAHPKHFQSFVQAIEINIKDVK